MTITYLVDSFVSRNTHSSIVYNCFYFISLCILVLVYLYILLAKPSSIDKKRFFMDILNP